MFPWVTILLYRYLSKGVGVNVQSAQPIVANFRKIANIGWLICGVKNAILNILIQYQAVRSAKISKEIFL